MSSPGAPSLQVLQAAVPVSFKEVRERLGLTHAARRVSGGGGSATECQQKLKEKQNPPGLLLPEPQILKSSGDWSRDREERGECADPLSLHHHADRCPAGGKGGQGGHQLLQWALSMLHLATGRLLRSKSAQEYKRQPSKQCLFWSRSAPSLCCLCPGHSGHA